MNEGAQQAERAVRVRKIFEDHDFGNAELLAGWDGRDLQEVAAFLTEEEFQTLLDELEDEEDGRE